MSYTTKLESVALERIRPANSSNGSLSIQARGPSLAEPDAAVLRKPHSSSGNGNGDIELAELPTRVEPDNSLWLGAGGTKVDSNSHDAKILASLQYATLCFTLFLAGWNDGTTGPLLPRMQEHYHVRTHTLLGDSLCADKL